jgi:DNA-directed RNA polymerase
LNTENAASTPVEELQRQRERREIRRAQEAAANQHKTLMARGLTGRTKPGARLMKENAERLSLSLDELLSELVVDPEKPGLHFAHWPLLLHFCDRGPRSISLIALGVVVDKITARPKRSALARAIGRALQQELEATRITKDKGDALFRHLRKEFGKRAVSARVMRQLRLEPSGWTVAEQTGVGNLLLEVIAKRLGLISFATNRDQTVQPSETVLELIKAELPWPLPIRDLPSLIPPEPWSGLQRGSKALITSRQPMAMDHLTPEGVKTALSVVNTVEQQELRVDPWMLRLQREAWDSNMPGLFPVSRDPQGFGSLPEEAALRCRIEEAIRQGEEVAGRPIWLKHDFDFRGRLYSSSRVLGHQGPDHQKALVSFAHGERMDDDAFEQLLAAAAGHYGLGHSSWAERVQWGRAHLDQIEAIVSAPLDRSDLWRSASDPWQYLQCCKAIADFLADDSKPCGCPVRFDQTCSGMGIIAALTRDQALARHTNMIGSTRRDLYAHMAEALTNQLRMDLDSFDFHAQRQAEFWLKKRIDRSLTKVPTMTVVYGAKYFSLVDYLQSWLQEESPDVPVSQWQWEYTRPASYMAEKLGEVIKAELISCVELETWLRKVSMTCIKKQQTVRWTSPMGFPLAFGNLLEEQEKTSTAIHGARRWKRHDTDVAPGELSARNTNRGITANTIHVFDAALVHAVVVACGKVRTPVLTNHDCFATVPSRATWLHQTLLSELRSLYLGNWLPEMRQEVSRNARVQLPHPPLVGDLCEGQIGQNPYVFC